MDLELKIKEELLREINLVFFELKDFTGRHLNHKQNDGGFHLEAIIVSDDFMGKSLILLVPKSIIILYFFFQDLKSNFLSTGEHFQYLKQAV